MSNTFNFNRFGKYYVSDLKNVFNNTWLTVLLTALSGLIAYLFCGTIHLFIDGEWASYGIVGRSITFFILIYVLVVTVPSKAYGFFTDKRSGGFYTMIPASPLEKFLSMFLNTALIAPLAYIAIALCADALLCLVDPSCGQTLIVAGADAAAEINDMFSASDGEEIRIFSTWELVCGVTVNLLSWTLVFLLGALYFKKNKIGKTILVMILFSMVSSMILTPISIHFGEGLVKWIEEVGVDSFANTFNAFKWGTYALGLIIVAGLAAWGYVRVRTVKH